MEIGLTPATECSEGRGRRSFSDRPIDHCDRSDLRRPHERPREMNRKSPPLDLSVSNMKLVSTLSAEAPEFVPRSNSHVPHSHSLHGSFVSGSVNQQAPLLESSFLSNVQTQDPFLHPSGPQLKYVNHPVILQVNHIVVNLTLKPHKYEQIASQMTSILSWKVKDCDLMKEIISVIFEQGVGEPNFRYNGGRLCQHLSKHVTLNYDGPVFRSLLMQKCQEEFSFRDYYLKIEPERLCGFTLFLADIFVHLLTSGGQPIEKLKEGLYNLLALLMTIPSPSNLKCVSQVLKGTGSYLEKGGDGRMDGVICCLKDIVLTANAKLGDNLRSLILSVIELRASNWGKRIEDQQSPTVSSESQTEDVTHVGTVYYGPGGVIQRVEEEIEDSESDDSYCGISPQVDELEGDVAQAFEQFLQNQNY